MHTHIVVKTNTHTPMTPPARRLREQPASLLSHAVLSRSELRRIVAEMLD